MRIIAGKHRSRKLFTGEGESTRPSSDRLKEAMFSRLGGYFDEGIWLDLFAGCGAIGLEAISRGVRQVIFCDHDRQAQNIIERNIALLKEEQNCELIKADYRQAISLCVQRKLTFDVIFLDPPYALDIDSIALEVVEAGLLSDDGWLICEMASSRVSSERLGNCVRIKESKYGLGKTVWYKKELRP
jgi:16S rRNA (guanine(966)-N(2))-methyltransferase RsmD